jgi:hypothetical protein
MPKRADESVDELQEKARAKAEAAAAAVLAKAEAKIKHTREVRAPKLVEKHSSLIKDALKRARVAVVVDMTSEIQKRVACTRMKGKLGKPGAPDPPRDWGFDARAARAEKDAADRIAKAQQSIAKWADAEAAKIRSAAGRKAESLARDAKRTAKKLRTAEENDLKRDVRSVLIMLQEVVVFVERALDELSELPIMHSDVDSAHKPQPRRRAQPSVVCDDGDHGDDDGYDDDDDDESYHASDSGSGSESSDSSESSES